MYIEPNSSFYILSGCPLNNNYEHTILFNDKTSQYNYFNSLIKHRLNKQSYQRYTDNTMRVQIKAEDLYDCDYLMFKNTSFGDKWFYAFILSVTYVNNITSEILYEIDVMQTWHFDYQLLPCFVEREHSATDVIGANTVPEDLQIGEYQTNATATIMPNEVDIAAWSTEAVMGQGYPRPLNPGSYGGALQSCYYYNFGPYSNPESFTKLTTFLSAVAGDEGTAQRSKAQVVSVFMQPVFLGTEVGSENSAAIPANRLPINVRNNKLYTYPYTCCVVQGDGQADVLRYEFFSGAPTITYTYNRGPNTELVAAPANYNGESYSYSHQLSVSGWPLIPWQIDSWQEWLARNKASLVGGVINTIARYVGHRAGFNAMNTKSIVRYRNKLLHSPRTAQGERKIREGAYNAETAGLNVSTVEGITNTLATIYEAKQIPDQMFGPISAQEVNAMLNRKGIYMYAKSIRPEYIRIVDDYFTMYGYATHRVKAPNRSARPRWNYVKTVGCLISGTVPADTGDVIKSVYDSGVTFWKNPSEIGDYTLDNSV